MMSRTAGCPSSQLWTQWSRDSQLTVRELWELLGGDRHAKVPESTVASIMPDKVHRLAKSLDLTGFVDRFPRRSNGAVFALRRDQSPALERVEFSQDVGLEPIFEELEPVGGDAGVRLDVSQRDGLLTKDVGGAAVHEIRIRMQPDVCRTTRPTYLT